MKPKFVLPDDVLEPLRANRKIYAIKLLREAQNLELKEVKIAIDDYIVKHFHLFTEGKRGDRISWVSVCEWYRRNFVYGILLFGIAPY